LSFEGPPQHLLHAAIGLLQKMMPSLALTTPQPSEVIIMAIGPRLNTAARSVARAELQAVEGYALAVKFHS
jgi:hypothetical protein